MLHRTDKLAEVEKMPDSTDEEKDSPNPWTLDTYSLSVLAQHGRYH